MSLEFPTFNPFANFLSSPTGINGFSGTSANMSEAEARYAQGVQNSFDAGSLQAALARGDKAGAGSILNNNPNVGIQIGGTQLYGGAAGQFIKDSGQPGDTAASSSGDTSQSAGAHPSATMPMLPTMTTSHLTDVIQPMVGDTTPAINNVMPDIAKEIGEPPPIQNGGNPSANGNSYAGAVGYDAGDYRRLQINQALDAQAGLSPTLPTLGHLSVTPINPLTPGADRVFAASPADLNIRNWSEVGDPRTIGEALYRQAGRELNLAPAAVEEYIKGAKPVTYVNDTTGGQRPMQPGDFADPQMIALNTDSNGRFLGAVSQDTLDEMKAFAGNEQSGQSTMSGLAIPMSLPVGMRLMQALPEVAATAGGVLPELGATAAEALPIAAELSVPFIAAHHLYEAGLSRPTSPPPLVEMPPPPPLPVSLDRSEQGRQLTQPFSPAAPPNITTDTPPISDNQPLPLPPPLVTPMQDDRLRQLASQPMMVNRIVKAAMLPTSGRIRYVPPTNWHSSEPLPRGPGGGYTDRFGNEWRRGPSRTPGEPFEWDVQLGRNATPGMRQLSPDGRHVNVSLKGKVTH